MINTLDLQSSVESLRQLTVQLSGDAQGFIDNLNLPKVPEYEKVQSRKVLYDGYSTVVEVSNALSKWLGKDIELDIQASGLRRAVRNSSVPPSIMKDLFNRLDDSKDLLRSVRDLIESKKYAVDNELRFYQSVQYILGSPRLNDLE